MLDPATRALVVALVMAVLSPVMAGWAAAMVPMTGMSRFRGVIRVSLNGIDISGWQPDLVPGNMSGTDFIIVKATGGASYRNGCFAGHADATLAAGKLLGCYHYARDRGYEGSAEAEADNFINAFKPYIGKAVPFLDWEADALGLGVAWAAAWLKRVYEKTGVVPGIYMSKSVCLSYDWSEVAKYCPLWCAQYPNYETTGYQAKPWTDSSGFGAWSGPTVFQYASTGRIAGYSGSLDLNIFYGTKADWKALCKVVKGGSSSGSGGKEKAVGISRANVAVQIMRHLCTCDLHGYSQPRRYGTSGYCSVATDAGTVKVKKGDRDCSSAVCEAWELALAGTSHEGEITRYHTTYDMKSMFLATGLFEVRPLLFNACPGDVYLNESQHTAMRIQNDGSADLLGEFSISETGGIDGEPGDQTGGESSVHGYYENWDFILHYNGLADGGGGSGGVSGDVDELARRVINGEFGSGDARRAALGSRYDEVQARVNEILDGGASGGGSGVDVDDLARRVIAGEFGNGEERKRRLGSLYSAVQKRVNEMLS